MRRLPLLWVLLLSAPAVLAEPAPTAEAEVERMARALGTLEYSGVFVLAHDGRLEAMQVTRSIDAAGPRDRVVALTGDRRELERSGSALRCMTPEGVVAVDAEGLGAWPPKIPSGLGSARAHYQFNIIGAERIAGYDATVVEALPQDEDRYGYRFWIERNTGMLVGSMLVDAARGAVNQMMFTQLSMREQVGADAAAARDQDAGSQDPPPVAPDGWTIGALPAGFALVALSPLDARARHLVYSDGLASVSVYIEPGEPLLLGPARRGSINAYGAAVDGHRVVTVGELPAATVQRIAVSVRRNPG
jgi:sigma-E factor negative regulatory protein RseB